jgi:hypothetical protein
MNFRMRRVHRYFNEAPVSYLTGWAIQTTSKGVERKFDIKISDVSLTFNPQIEMIKTRYNGDVFYHKNEEFSQESSEVYTGKTRIKLTKIPGFLL